MIPLIIIPPFLGSNLWISYNKTDLPWYCPKKMNDSPLWLYPPLAIPPFHNCLLKLLTLEADENGEVYPYTNTTFNQHDFGGVESITHTLIFINKFMRFWPVYAPFVKYFEEKGYKVKKDLFAAPYDSRLGPNRIPEYYGKLKDLIFEAYNKNGQQKVVLCGFSLGGSVLQKLLTEKTDKAFRDKYISKGVLIGPGFGGSMPFFRDLLTKRTSYVPSLDNENLKKLIESWPTFQEIMPNPILHEEVPLLYNEEGSNFKGKDLKEFLIAHKIFEGNYLKSFLKTYERVGDYLKEPDVPIDLIYNSGRPTIAALNFTNGFDKMPVDIIGKGDGTIGSFGLEKICSLWKNAKCYNVDCDGPTCIHGSLIKNVDVLDAVYNTTYGRAISLNTKRAHKLTDDL